jgi:hypothetical protein
MHGTADETSGGASIQISRNEVEKWSSAAIVVGAKSFLTFWKN